MSTITMKDAVAIVNGLTELCREQGDAVTLHTPTAIGVDAAWTGWKEERFYGDTLLDSVEKALSAKDRAERQ